ncbi:MAG: hypothetical protein JNM56_21395 [Planctomycetia bacterium]|nr:hypothetical protein [Planctomycetia bacterium]
MNEPPLTPEDPVDQLVRAYLHQRTDGDAAAGLRRIHATLHAAPPPARPRRRGWWAAAAVVLLVLAGSLYLTPARANPATLVRQAQQVHALPVDRCYLVETRLEPGSADARHPLWSASRQTRLWTRGDRFWIESGPPQRRWNWGRADDGKVWLAVSPNRGLRFDAGETPEALANLCDVYSMRIETLLGEVLAAFDLHLEDGEPGSDRIRAAPRPERPHPTVRGVQLDIDAETKVLRHVVIARAFRGRAPTTTTFTLIDTQTFDDARYQLEGHLTAPYQIYSRTFEPQRRRELLLGRFGQRALE